VPCPHAKCRGLFLGRHQTALAPNFVNVNNMTKTVRRFKSVLAPSPDESSLFPEKPKTLFTTET
jgi:hypothetical protein